MVTVTLLLDRDLGLGAPGVPARADVRHRPSRSGGDEPSDIRRYVCQLGLGQVRDAARENSHSAPARIRSGQRSRQFRAEDRG